MTDHFAGKNVVDHLREARLKGFVASAEIHGIETPGYLSAAVDALHDSLLSLLILWSIFPFLPENKRFPLLVVFGLSFCIWKTGRSALLGWRRMNRLHKLIEEERFEIQHHRSQEKEELKGLYAAKGFEGKLLDEVVEVLMADEDRLLKVMLEEELGLTLETYEHPLKQSLGACLGALIALSVLSVGFFFSSAWGMPIGAAILLISTTAFLSQKEIKRVLPTLTWVLAVMVLVTFGAKFLAEWIFS